MCHIKGEITSNRAIIIAAIAALATVSVAASALGSAGELRVEAPANPDFLDPALAYDPLSWQVMAATQGGLLAFRRESGTSGASLVPDLAQALPSLSRDGRVLTFTLRDDVRFAPPVSRPANASDVKASLERMLWLDSRGADLYRSIQGAPDVIAHRSRVLGGVTADDTARKVVITLTRRDATLTEALALPFASILPKGTKPVDQTVDPPPGIGAYVVSDFNPGSSITLTPNTGFAARDGLPAGRSSRVTIALARSPRQAAVRVAAADADYSVSPIPLSATKTGGYASGATANAVTQSATAYVAIDATKAPFTNAGVRRAVGLALDRAAAARAVATGARATDRMIPPGTPGNRRASTAPNLRAARSLVAAAGATGQRVTLWTGSAPIEQAIAPAVRDALSGAGLTPVVKTLPRNSGLGRSAPRAAIATALWTQTTPDGSDAYAQLLGTTEPGTPAAPPFPAISGDASLRSAARAANGAAVGAARDSAWAQVDARAVADGRVVPVATPVQTQVTAPGVSGVTVNPVFGVLLGAMQPSSTQSN
jgi:peptide/nickel transport system substrate-binding protein